MLNQPLNITKINIVLGLIVVILSFYTIIWHHQNYLLYKEYQVVQKQNQQIMAMRKQLLSEYSEKISGAEIKKKALNVLQMKSVNPNKVRAILL
jgi:cell division protein FtsL